MVTMEISTHACMYKNRNCKKDSTVQTKTIKVGLVPTLAVDVLGGDFGDIGNLLSFNATSLTTKRWKSGLAT